MSSSSVVIVCVCGVCAYSGEKGVENRMWGVTTSLPSTAIPVVLDLGEMLAVFLGAVYYC